MRTLALLVAAIATVGGIAADLPQPVLFAHESVEVTAAGGPPRAFQGAKFYELDWKATPLPNGATRWTGVFPEDAPLGPWYVTVGDECLSFLRVSDDRAILIVRGAAGMTCYVGEEARIGDSSGTCWFVLDPGSYTLVADFPTGERATEVLTLAAGERRVVTLLSVTVITAAPAALSGYSFLVVLRVISSVDIPRVLIDAKLPPGWKMRIRGPCMETLPCPLPVYAEVPTKVELIFEVPEDAKGRYEIPLYIPAYGLEKVLVIEVRNCLDPLEVVRHWDVKGDDVDLTVEGDITYERLLWAIAHVGKKIPFSCRYLTRADIEILAEEWEAAVKSEW
jgi:hypothetical protein